MVRDEGELLSIGVGPAYRRRAIGTALLRESMERCRRAGAGVMFLEVATDNRSAQALYQTVRLRRGRQSATATISGPNGTRVSAYTMRCDLAALGRARRTRPRLWR